MRPDLQAIDASLKTLSTAKVAGLFGASASTIAKHKLKCKPPVPPKPLKVVEIEDVPLDATPQEQAAWHCERIKARMLAAEKAGSSEKEIASLYGQYTNALRHHARLSGALDITESQILRSAPWTRIKTLAVKALEKDYPKALAAMFAILDDACAGKL